MEQKFLYLSKLSSFPEIMEDVVPIVIGNFQEFKPVFFVKWKAPNACDIWFLVAFLISQVAFGMDMDIISEKDNKFTEAVSLSFLGADVASFEPFHKVTTGIVFKELFLMAINSVAPGNIRIFLPWKSF